MRPFQKTDSVLAATGTATTSDKAGLLLLCAALATAGPLFVVTYLPFTDMPEHVAVMATLRHWFDPAWRIQEHYVLALRSQYALYHLAGALLTALVGDAERANRLLMAASAICLPFALRSLLRAFGRDERIALLACPLFWSRPLVIGFLPYMASLPLMLYTLAAATRQHQQASTRRAVWLAVLTVLLFYLHASAFALLGVITVALALVHAVRVRTISLRHLALHLGWLIPSGVCAVTWWILGRMTLNASSLSDPGEIGHMAPMRLARAISLWSHDIWVDHVDEMLALAYWCVFATILIAGMWKRRGEFTPCTDFLPLLPFACALAVYFVIPFRIGAGAMLNVRLAPVLALFALVALPPLPRKNRALEIALAAGFFIAIATPANAARVVLAAEREEANGIDEALAVTRPGARLVELSFDMRSRYQHFPPWVHLGAYHRARKGGVSSYSFTELHHWSLHFVKANAPPKKSHAFWEFDPCLFRNAQDGQYYDYVLVRGRLDPFRDHPPGPAWKVSVHKGDFTLYEKVSDETYPTWATADLGPCRDRSESEAAKPAMEIEK